MDLGNFDKQLQLLQCVGYTLNIDEKLKIKVGHIQIMSNNPDLEEVKFWGKIQGVTKNYYIMVGLTYTKCYQFCHKKFFWANQDFIFKQLPQILVQHQGFADKYNNLFSGDPNKILVNLEGQAGEEPPQQNNQNPDQPIQPKIKIQEDEDLKKLPKKNFTELHRLSIVVRAIQNDAQCVPKSSYQMNVQHELHPKINYYGLNKMNACDLKSWNHFRAPQTQQAKMNMENDMAVFSSNLLDDISFDSPTGVWSVQLDSQSKNVSVRNLLWPGYYAFHRLQSNIFGGAYFGDGVKNVDLPFMI